MTPVKQRKFKKLNYHKASRTEIAKHLSHQRKVTLRKDGNLCLLCGTRCAEGTLVFKKGQGPDAKVAHVDCVDDEYKRDKQAAIIEANKAKEIKLPEPFVVVEKDEPLKELKDISAERDYYKGMVDGMKLMLDTWGNRKKQ